MAEGAAGAPAEGPRAEDSTVYVVVLMHGPIGIMHPNDAQVVSTHRTIEGALDAMQSIHAEPHYHHVDDDRFDREEMAAELRQGQVAAMSIRIGGSSECDLVYIEPVELHE